MAWYGVGDGWCFACGGFAGHVKLTFGRGTSLTPVPPVTPIGMGKDSRGVDLESLDDLDEPQVASWMRAGRGDPRFRETMNGPASITVTPIHVADLLAEGELMPVYVHVIDHPDGRVLVDTGMTELHPAVADMDPRLRPLSEQDFDLAGIDIVVNTHLHFDHCGGNHLFAGKPIYVQRQELDDARSQDDYTIREWVDAPGVRVRAGRRRARAASRASGSSRRRATRAARRWSSSRPAGVRSSSPATWRSGSASSTSRRPKASSWCARSTPSWSGSRTCTSRGDRR